METKINLPEEFVRMCEYMDVSTTAFLEKFVRNILSYEDVDDPDGAEIAMAIRYFLIYSANRNRMYERQVHIREAFINKTVVKLNPFLFDLIDNNDIVLETELLEFIQDWKSKWKKVNTILYEEKEDIQPQETQGKPVSQDKFVITRNIQPFESIGIDISSDIILRKGVKESIRIESKQDIANVIHTIVEDKRLWISIRNDFIDVIPHALIYVTYCNLNGIVVHHSGNVTCTEPIECPRLGIIQNGKGNIDLQVDVTSLDATVTKAGKLKISGSANEATILNTGPGAFDGIGMETDVTKVTIKDSGPVSVHVDEELSAVLEGTGNLLLKGEPRLKSFVMP